MSGLNAPRRRLATSARASCPAPACRLTVVVHDVGDRDHGEQHGDGQRHLGAGPAVVASMRRRTSTQETNVAISGPITASPSRSRMNDRITRGENWLLG